jgi:hypothetical protein
MATEIELLTTLRYAAQQNDWNGCRDAVEALLARLPVPTMLQIAYAEVERRLPVFEQYHPTMRWPRIWLEALATGAPFTFDESTPEVMEEAPGPGGNSFTEAVQQLALAGAADGTQRVEHIITAISRAISSEKTEAGARDHRERWDLWFQAALKAEGSKHLWVLGTIARDPKAVATAFAAWNRLADELAAALGVAG